jgi:hypothetical protein
LQVPSCQIKTTYHDELKPNNGSRPERPRWAEYEDFEENIDDFGHGGSKDETIS